MAERRSCNELEYMVLAMIASDITSGYAMRKYVMAMRGGRWSTESGSIYRGLQRLLAAGYIEEKGKAGSVNRPRTEYRLSALGKHAVSAWVSSPIESDLMEVMDDPVRARAHFLSLIPSANRSEVVKGWIRDTESLIASVERDIERFEGPDSKHRKLMLGGYRNLLGARVDWLKKVAMGL